MYTGSATDASLTFGEFVEVSTCAFTGWRTINRSLPVLIIHHTDNSQLVATFACFEKRELIRYLFYILDPNRTGLIEKVIILQKQSISGSIFITYSVLCADRIEALCAQHVGESGVQEHL